MKCAACGENFNDGVFCNGCNSHLDFGCAHIGEVGYRRLGRDRQAAWRCPQCKVSMSRRVPTTPVRLSVSTSDITCNEHVNEASGITPAASPSEIPEGAITMEVLFKEIQGIKQHLNKIPHLVVAVESIKNELSDLKSSIEFSSARLDEFETRVSKVELLTPEVDKVSHHLDSVTKDIVTLKSENISREQWARLNNVEIKGVPPKKNENLFSILEKVSEVTGYRFPKTQINYIARVPTYDSGRKNIIVSFINRYIKEEFVAAARSKKIITAADLGFGDSSLKIFINDHLTSENKELLSKVKTAAKDKNFLYIWVKHSKIHIRKNDTSPVYIISKLSDLNKLN